MGDRQGPRRPRHQPRSRRGSTAEDDGGKGGPDSDDEGGRSQDAPRQTPPVWRPLQGTVAQVRSPWRQQKGKLRPPQCRWRAGPELGRAQQRGEHSQQGARGAPGARGREGATSREKRPQEPPRAAPGPAEGRQVTMTARVQGTEGEVASRATAQERGRGASRQPGAGGGTGWGVSSCEQRPGSGARAAEVGRPGGSWAGRRPGGRAGLRAPRGGGAGSPGPGRPRTGPSTRP